MMKKILITLFAVVTLAVVADPRKSMLATRDDTTDTEPLNYWSWPTEWASYQNISPSRTWFPGIGKWYGSFIASGYMQNRYRGTFADDSITVIGASGYAMACFVDLPQGDYVVGFDCTVASEPRVTAYRWTDSGYIFDGYASIRIAKGGGEFPLQAEPGCIYALIFYPYPGGTEGTFSNITITRIEN